MTMTSFPALLLLLVALLLPTPCAGGSLGSPLPLPFGDWVVRTPIVLADVTLTLRGNLIVVRGGSLDLRGVTLHLEGSTNGERRVEVQDGGRLSASRSPLTGRITTIDRGDAGRYAFEVAAGGELRLLGATIRGAGWDDDHPGLVVTGSPHGPALTAVDCDFVGNFVGLTLRNASAEIAAARFESNDRAGLVLDRSTAEIQVAYFADEPTGVVAGAGSTVRLTAVGFFAHGIGLESAASEVEVSSGLFVDNGVHARLAGPGNATMHDSLFVVGVEAAVIVTGGARPLLRFNDFVWNTIGVRNDGPNVVVDARENYWGSASGPGGVGPGDGDPVSEGVGFQPWCTESCRRSSGS